MNFSIKKVISGGQTGADLAGLIAAKNCNILTGGTAPTNFKTENGSNYDLKTIYGLVAKGGYKSRTMQNVRDSDGTIAFSVHQGPGGTSKTIGYCATGKWVNKFETKNDGFKPILVIKKHEMELDQLENVTFKIIKWMQENKIETLNIAGHRQSTAFSQPFYNSPPYDYQFRVKTILENTFQMIKKMK